MSNDPLIAENISQAIRWTPGASLLAFAFAHRIERGETSVATTKGQPDRASIMATRPQPVPISNARLGLGVRERAD